MQNKPVKLIRLHQFIHELSGQPHRHDHYTLMYITKGHGYQTIDENEYEMKTNRVFFLHPGQVHKMMDFQREGWLLLFDDVIYNSFLRYHPLEELYGIMDNSTHSPYTDLDETTMILYNQIFETIQFEAKQETVDTTILSHLIAILITSANKVYDIQKNLVTVERNGVKEIVRKVKQLIEKNFRQKQSVEFYCQQLNIQSRRLNDITKSLIGQSVHELLEDRLITESKILLETSSFTVKEICYSLGFADPSYFNRFFKKRTQKTPLQFRNDILSKNAAI